MFKFTNIQYNNSARIHYEKNFATVANVLIYGVFRRYGEAHIQHHYGPDVPPAGVNSSQDATGAGLPGVINAYVKYNDPSCVDSLAILGVTVQTVTPSILTALIPADRVYDVAALESVECVQAAQPAKMLMDAARSDTRVTDIHSATPPLETPFSGKGTIVGVIDGGVDFTHPAFFAQDGTAAHQACMVPGR